MDTCRLSAVLAVIFAALCVVTSGMSIPSNELKGSDVDMVGSDSDVRDEGRRASWLETRDLEDSFKDLILLTLQELANEGRINQDLLIDEESTKQKRGRWQGFCFKRTKSGRFLPYICWKGDK